MRDLWRTAIESWKPATTEMSMETMVTTVMMAKVMEFPT